MSSPSPSSLSVPSAAQPRPDLLRTAAGIPPPDRLAGPDLLDLRVLGRYLRHVADEDLQADRPADLAGAVRSHLETAADRPEREAVVRVLHPSAEDDGWSCSYAVLQIVTDDMPFLVDSVTAELQRHDRDVHRLIHPVLTVRRDLAGRLLAVEPDDGDDTGLRTESFIHLEIDLAHDAEADRALEADLRRVLEDVRDAVEDWPKMRAACLALAAGLRQDPPAPVPGEVSGRTADFLQWLAEDHFTFLGYKEYVLESQDGQDVLRSVPGTGLGVLRWDEGGHAGSGSVTPLAGRVAELAREPRLLMLTKANSRSTVHRPAYLDYVGVKVFDGDRVVGERRLLGLYTSTAYTDPIRRIPIVRERVDKVMQRAGFTDNSHSGKDLLTVLETYPRDEMLQTSSEDLHRIGTTVLRLAERRQAHLFLREDEWGRFVSALVYLPRDRYNTAVRLRMEAIVREAYGAESVDFTTQVGESALARLHFVVRVAPGATLPPVDPARLQERLVAATQTWGERLGQQALLEEGKDAAARVTSLYARAFPEAYKEDFSPRQGLADLRRLEALESPEHTLLTLYREPGADERERRFKIFRRSRLILTQVMPVFTDLGVEVTDERPYEMERADGEEVFVYDFGLRAQDPAVWGRDETQVERARSAFQEAFAAVWEGRAESDGFNALVLAAGLTWRQVAVLRTVARYLRQIGTTFSNAYLIQALTRNVGLARLVVELFEARFDPGAPGGEAERERREAELVERLEAALDEVVSLDEDRIIRSFAGVVRATLRTNAFQVGAEGAHRPVISLKLDCAAVPGLPSPRPMFEVWVYSPRVEGVHLRFGPVARGGLRWSDRLEDFRTEVLGLVKAQMVKNAVIVPTGSKGGFVAKQLPPPGDRDAWLAEGVEAYKGFISGLLDVTDNLVDGQVVPPQRVVRHDGDDTYLVVAADKGTASFSDIANGVARDYGFWLDDAFASGGSAGYDHKAMGITARGAWESVRRHFRDLGVDCQREDFTAVGVGDMSGDVFGNGMLLSEHTRLVAAFDHRHVFLDPDPDAARSCVERRRLFELPRSSWADYDPAVISAGGGVWPRTAKSVPVSEQARAALGLPEGTTALSPAELVRAVLLAPVDLLWNGGIGTYVKSSTETHADIGDRANDAVRVDGSELRCRIVGEGGNLGLSQLGRIEAAAAGVRLNTDAIDNSAGVDTSDHEVNIKILLSQVVRDGGLDLPERNELLQSMTDEVAHQVLRDNYEQNTLLGNARAQENAMLTVHRRLMARLEERGELDRALEFLPSDAELDRRAAQGAGLTSPELSVLLAYAKLALKNDLQGSDLASDPWFGRTLAEYFPTALRERYAGPVEQHPLRAQIVVNSLVNSVVNRGGMTFVHRAQEETGAETASILRAFVVAREVFGLSELVAQVEALDNRVPTAVQTTVYLELRRLIDRATRWLLQAHPADLDVGEQVDRLAGPVGRLIPTVPDMLRGAERERWERRRDELVEQGLPAELAGRSASLLDEFSLLDVVERATERGEEPEQVARLYFALSERLGIDHLLMAVSALPRQDRWEALARGAVRDDLYGVIDALTAAVLAATPAGPDVEARLAQWSAQNQGAVDRSRRALAELAATEQPSLARLSVALRTLRSVVRAGAV